MRKTNGSKACARIVMQSLRHLLTLISILVVSIAVAGQDLDTAKIDQALGRSGQRIGDVYKVGFPRTDLHVSVHGVAIKPGLALGSNRRPGAALEAVADRGFVAVLVAEAAAGERSRFSAAGIEDHAAR